MSLSGRKLGLLVAAPPSSPNFRHAIELAAAALRRGVKVYLYCIDEAVRGLGDTGLQSLKQEGLNLFACAYGAQKRGIAVSELAHFSGLATVADIMASTDRFLNFN